MYYPYLLYFRYFAEEDVVSILMYDVYSPYQESGDRRFTVFRRKLVQELKHPQRRFVPC